MGDPPKTDTPNVNAGETQSQRASAGGPQRIKKSQYPEQYHLIYSGRVFADVILKRDGTNVRWVSTSKYGNYEFYKSGQKYIVKSWIEGKRKETIQTLAEFKFQTNF